MFSSAFRGQLTELVAVIIIRHEVPTLALERPGGNRFLHRRHGCSALTSSRKSLSFLKTTKESTSCCQLKPGDVCLVLPVRPSPARQAQLCSITKVRTATPNTAMGTLTLGCPQVTFRGRRASAGSKSNVASPCWTGGHHACSRRHRGAATCLHQQLLIQEM